MTLDVGTAAGIIGILSFFGAVLVVLGVRSPRDVFQDIKAIVEAQDTRLRTVEYSMHGTIPLWDDRHKRHDEALEDLTVALNALGEKIDQLGKAVEARVEQVERRIDGIASRNHV